MTQRTNHTEERPATGLVLVADDDPTMRAMAQAVLEQDGHQVALARDGGKRVVSSPSKLQTSWCSTY